MWKFFAPQNYASIEINQNSSIMFEEFYSKTLVLIIQHPKFNVTVYTDMTSIETEPCKLYVKQISKDAGQWFTNTKERKRYILEKYDVEVGVECVRTFIRIVKTLWIISRM